MGSRGSQDPRWQRWIPKAVPVARILAGAGASKLATCYIPMPDSRLRVKASLLYVPDTNSIGVAPLAEIAVFESDNDDSGRNGATVRLTSIDPTTAALLSIPANANLSGYSREFVSAADYIEIDFNGFSNGAQGYWSLQTRYQPRNAPFSKEEWDIVIAQCNPFVSTYLTVGTPT